MRVLGVLPWARYTPHFETDLEILEGHLARGDEVEAMCCHAELPACDRNPRHAASRCRTCTGRLSTGLGLLSRPVRRRPILEISPADAAELAALRTDFATVEELKRFGVESFDLGYAVLSSAISFLRDPDPVSAANRPWIRNLLLSALAVYRSVRRRLATDRCDRVYVFNGRFAITRAVLRACAAEGVECFTHERGCDHTRYALHRNTTVHDPAAMHRAILAAWEAEPDDARRRAVGARFYEERARGQEQAWFSFVKDQRGGLLPEGFDHAGRNVVVYNSSEDEFAAIGDAWENSLYATQNEGIARLLASFAGRSDIRFWLRVHPNLRGVANRQTREIAALSATNLVTIPADSPISSYALLRSAWKVVTFGSTVGIEATHHGIPSVLLGPAFYRDLGATWNPATHEEAVDLISRDLAPKPAETTLPYGFYLKTFGLPFRHYRPEGVFRGKFRGRTVRPGILPLAAAAALRALPPLETALSAHGRRRCLRAMGRRPDGDRRG